MTKIDIVSGFLGAGKTTFIQKMLKEVLNKEKVVLIENEFGEIGIDGGFLKEAGIEIKEMNSRSRNRDKRNELRMYLLFARGRFRRILKRSNKDIFSRENFNRAFRCRKAF